MMKTLRAQVQNALYAVPAKRKPALRRSDAPDALLATDLTLIAGAEEVARFCEDIGRLGWRTSLRRGWLTLDAPVPVPEAVLDEPGAGECACCISLLKRHPDDAPAEQYIRAVVKAADAGLQPFERLCGELHAEFAARLRRHEALPGVLLPYLCEASRTLREGEST